MIEEMNKSRDPYSLRVAIVMMIIIVMVIIVMVRLAAIQLFDSEGLRGYAGSQGMRSEEILPERGLILDRNGKILANNVIEYNIGARYIDLLEPENCYAALAKAFDKTPEYYRSQFKKESSFYMLETNVRPEIVAELRRNKGCHGLNYDKKMSRIYPYQDAAGQLLGFLSADGSAQTGIEKYYDTLLKGEKGFQMIQRDKRGDIITLQNTKTKEAVPGGDVKLTIDVEYQIILEEELAKAVERSKGKSGMAVIMDPNSGEVLAMANYPAFNPNKLRSSTDESRRNKVIADQFEPGSVYKFIPLTAALENHILSPESRIFCENGQWRVHDRTIHDTKEHEWLTVEEVLVYSSNIGAGKIAEQVGDQTIYDISRKFGFGEPTAIGLWGESAGLLKTPDKWSSVGFTQLAMGQGVTVTLMQMMAAYSAIANGGTLLKPYLVSETYDEKNKLKAEFGRSPVRKVISEETAAVMRGFMEEVVNKGTAPKAKIEGYHVAGKTGTAQKVEDGKYSNSKYYASFIGFFPSDEPVLVCGVVIDEPAFGLHHGGTASAPAVKNTFTRIINTSDFNKHYPAIKKIEIEDEAIADQKPTQRSKPVLSILHSDKAEKTNDKPVERPKTIPEPQQPQSAQGDFDIIMPDVTGLHVLNAANKLKKIGLNVEYNSDRGKVKYQIPSAGSYLKKGALCRLEVKS
jgi:cell division protein FtsI (penicillin-binding protein 3)